MTIDAAGERAELGKAAISAGDWVTIDGDSGKIFLGRREVLTKRPEAELAEIAKWRSELRGSAGRRRRSRERRSAAA